MLPCCKLTYAKYIERDGTIDEQAARKFIAEALRAPGMTDKRAKRATRNQPPAPEQPLDLLCRCACHVKGNNVLH